MTFLLGMVAGAGLLLAICQTYKWLLVKLTSPYMLRQIHERLDAHSDLIGHLNHRIDEQPRLLEAAIVKHVRAPTERARGRSV